jgi:hypothetical protein
VVINLLRVGLVWATLRMLPLERGLLKAIPAALGAAVVAMIVSQYTEGAVTLATGTVGVAAAYTVVVLALGIGPEDRLVLGTLGRRLRWKSA